MSQITLDRRRFLLTASVVAGGMLLGIRPCKADDVTFVSTGLVPWGPDVAEGNELSAWVEIAPDDTVTIRVPAPEIGNGVATQIAMNITEELSCAWSNVRVKFCSVHRDHMENGIYNTGFLPFFGGRSTSKERISSTLQLGASARERLKSAAAAHWQVPVAQIIARDSLLTHTSTGRRLRYGELAAEAAQIVLPAEPTPKPPSEWTFLGKSCPGKLHNPEIVTGAAIFGIDVKLPGMVHAALLQSPVHGGRLKDYSPELVLDMPGVRAVVALDSSKTRGSPVEHKSTWGFDTNQTQSGVAVIADHYWQAKKALDVLPLEWNLGEGAKWERVDEIYGAAEELFDEDTGQVLHQSGDVDAVIDGNLINETYATPYCENAMMEPLNGTALVTRDSTEVWCPSQDMLQAYWVAIDETGHDPEQVKVHQTYVGGRFGRGTQADDVRMVVAVAKEYPGVPVKTIWSREECFRQARLRTPIITRFAARLGKDGYPASVKSKVVFVGTEPLFQLSHGYSDVPYFTSGIIPNIHISSTNYPLNVLNGAYRGPCYNSNVFIVETFIDECAVLAGIDPLEYRTRLVSKWDQAWTDCLRVAAEKSGWGQPLAKGEGMGIAIGCFPKASKRKHGTIICAAVRLSVSSEGQLRLKQVDIAFDCGRVMNADAVRAQIEGGTIYGINMTLNEQITLMDGVIVESNFHQYPMLRLGDNLPEINIHFDALSGHERWDAIGEAPVGPIGPAIGNAIFQATGKRLRKTPFVNYDLRWL